MNVIGTNVLNLKEINYDNRISNIETKIIEHDNKIDLILDKLSKNGIIAVGPYMYAYNDKRQYWSSNELDHFEYHMRRYYECD